MTYTQSDRDRWVRQLRDAAIELTCAGVPEGELHDLVLEGVVEGQRLNALRAATATSDTVPAPRSPDATRPAVTPEPGSALARLASGAGI
ncbi:hypothetical protein [Micromonospora costi]|nr:hypothetical protein [Micromonospora costi]